MCKKFRDFTELFISEYLIREWGVGHSVFIVNNPEQFRFSNDYYSSIYVKNLDLIPCIFFSKITFELQQEF